MVPPPADHREFMRPRNLTALYRYYDKNGALLFYVARRDLANGGKDILPYTYGILDGRFGWYCKRGNPPLPLYGLRYLALAPVDWDIFIVEGEKACDALNKQLRVENYAAFAMTWPGGTDNVMYCDWNVLRDRSVILWPDADDVGLKAMNQIAKLCDIHAILITARITVSGLPAGFDAADLKTPLEPFLRERCR